MLNTYCDQSNKYLWGTVMQVEDKYLPLRHYWSMSESLQRECPTEEVENTDLGLGGKAFTTAKIVR